MHSRFALVSTVALTLALAGPAFAQNTTTRAPQQQMSKQDMNFMKEAATGGVAEVELGKLAQQNGQSDAVKQFGARMVQDHGKANDQLMSIAQARGIQLPQQTDAKHQQLMNKLSREQGAGFDRAYMAAMVKDHDQDIKAFQREANSSRDPELKQFAANTLTVIQQHDQLAHNVEQSTTATGSSRPPRR